MKQLTSEIQDIDTLQSLGRASVQIVHDLKNQLNGLKLYATFLRKRMEKADRPEDERETIAKLIAGLEHAASDMNVLVRFGRPIDLRRSAGVKLEDVFTSVTNDEESAGKIRLEIEDAAIRGEFDPIALAEALRSVTRAAIAMRSDSEPLQIHIRREDNNAEAFAVIDWRGAQPNGDDVFRSFAGSDALRMALAARIIEAHNGTVQQQANMLSARLPINTAEGT